MQNCLRSQFTCSYALCFARDILRRTAVSRFSAPASSVLDFLPVSMFNWPSNALSHNKADMEECVRKLEEATMLWFSRHSEANISCPMEGEDFAVWLLICTSSDSSAQSHYSSNCHLKSDGCWRLGLLIKDMVILGAALQLRCFLSLKSFNTSIMLRILCCLTLYILNGTPVPSLSSEVLQSYPCSSITIIYSPAIFDKVDRVVGYSILNYNRLNQIFKYISKFSFIIIYEVK